MTMTMTTDLYTAYPAALAAFARAGEARITTALTLSGGSADYHTDPALALELPATLLAYRQTALAYLAAVAASDLSDDEDACRQYLAAQLDNEAARLLDNAAARVLNRRRTADAAVKDYIAMLQRRARLARIQGQGGAA